MGLQTIALYRKKTTPAADRVAREVRAWAEHRGLRVLGEEALGELIAGGGCSGVDLVVVLGGDGTLLSAVRALAGCEVPVLGVNLGRLGFLTEIALDELYPALERVLAGEIRTEPRTMLTCAVARAGRTVATYQVLNDVVLNNGALARISDFSVRVDGCRVSNYRSDGFIVSTPTGSTAYNLSAGGPIVSPDLAAFVLTPICPHTLTHRPILVPDSAVVEICLEFKNGEVYLTLDGQQGVELAVGDVVRVARAAHRVLLVRSPERDFFQVLRSKLHWGGRGPGAGGG
ncbi:MAG TPA: NAD(+)/NADH kinase [Deferrisomatales bacterium]|nr:NAD(+)/NADH kinase [Deferrisomatales bacterium]